MTTEAIAELDRRYAVPGRARVTAGRGGLARITAQSKSGSGEIYLHGGQVTSWTPAGFGDVLFVSREARWEEGRAIRGGIPVCFPWFGAKADNPQAPAHGFVRLLPWHIESIAATADAVVVHLFTTSTDETRRLWPADFRLQLAATFGASLRLGLTVTNTGTSDLTCEEALHTYFAVGDVRRIRLHGLDGGRYVDKVGGSHERVQEGDIGFTGETDRIYQETVAMVEIDDPVAGRRIHIAKSHSDCTVVWNPWIGRAKALSDFGDDEWPGMVCVETCNVSPSLVTVAPGQQHTMSADITVM